MIDIKFIRENPKLFDEGMMMRGEDLSSETIIALDSKIRSQKTLLQELQGKRNKIAKDIGTLKFQKSDVPKSMGEEAESIRNLISRVELDLEEMNNQLNNMLLILPNIPDAGVPFGKNDTENIVIREVGVIKKFDFMPKQHFEINSLTGKMDFEVAAKISGSRFVVLKKDLALMERALINFMLDHHVDKYQYQEISVPYLVNEKSMLGTGQLPKFEDDAFKTTDRFMLIPTAEVPLTNMVADSIIEEKDLPIRFSSHSACFRSEAGSAGRDTRGMLRQHQFHKVELVSIVKPTDSEQELERMVGVAESILQLLKLPYRVVLLCSQDMGFTAKKTYDLEVWMPGQKAYREISSCSNCGSFQSRRMKARYRDATSKDLEFMHTLNGSALAVGRTMIAIIENYQNQNGDIAIPEVLQEYMKGKKTITVD